MILSSRQGRVDLYQDSSEDAAEDAKAAVEDGRPSFSLQCGDTS